MGERPQPSAAAGCALPQLCGELLKSRIKSNSTQWLRRLLYIWLQIPLHCFFRQKKHAPGQCGICSLRLGIILSLLCLACACCSSALLVLVCLLCFSSRFFSPRPWCSRFLRVGARSRSAGSVSGSGGGRLDQLHQVSREVSRPGEKDGNAEFDIGTRSRAIELKQISHDYRYPKRLSQVATIPVDPRRSTIKLQATAKLSSLEHDHCSHGRVGNRCRSSNCMKDVRGKVAEICSTKYTVLQNLL